MKSKLPNFLFIVSMYVFGGISIYKGSPEFILLSFYSVLILILNFLAIEYFRRKNG